MKFKCKNCLKEFKDYPSSNRQFCSNRCKTIAQFKNPANHWNWRGGKKTRNCAVCNCKVQRKPSDMKGKNIFCSGLCRNMYNNKNQSKRLTDIELNVLKALAKKGIQFTIQYIFPKICVADFYLPKHKIAIFCDGEYWHSYPKGKPKDKWDLEQLKKIGIKGIRLWGKQCLEEHPLKYLEQFVKDAK